MSSLKDTIDILAEVLQLGERAQSLDENTALLGSVPEFDSMAVVSVITAVEENFGLVIDDDEVTAELFETVGSLSDFIEHKMSS
ncbi:MAG: phosphopantetheine-binding protein [Sedimenticola sp.]